MERKSIRVAITKNILCRWEKFRKKVGLLNYRAVEDALSFYMENHDKKNTTNKAVKDAA